jgi:hypothetical protein
MKKQSRMDPMQTYDAGALALQIDEHRKKAESLEEDAKSFLSAAAIERKQIDDLGKILSKVRLRDRQKARGD